MDPQQKLLVSSCGEALADAGIDPWLLAGREVGCSWASLDATTRAARPALRPYCCRPAALSIAANRISYPFDLRGPSLP